MKTDKKHNHRDFGIFIYKEREGDFMKIITTKKRDISLIVIMLLWVAVMVFCVWNTLATTASAEIRRIPVYSVDTDVKEVAFTFNCAWGTDGLDEILQLLTDEGIKCTFFFVGDFAKKYPEAVRRIYNAGHETGNHSMKHKDPVKQTYEEILSDITACNELLYSITGCSPVLYRAPSGSYDNKTIEAAESLGMTAVQWDVDSIDWRDLSVEKIISRVTSKVTCGSIVLFHLGKENTLKALPDIIKTLKKEGYSFTTVGKLLPEGECCVDHAGRLFRKS